MSAQRPPQPTQPPNYWEYIRVEELLTLQRGLAADEGEITNDEVLFVTVHQIYELWFKLALRELVSLRDLFKGEAVQEQKLSRAVRGARRVVTILRSCIDHFEVMETLTTREYLGFRDKLMPASGFQSAQLRQIEILLGLRDEERLSLGGEESYVQALRRHDGAESPASRRVERQKKDLPTLATAVAAWLHRTPIGGKAPGEAGAEDALQRFLEQYVAAQHAEVDRSCELALARTFSDTDRDLLRQRYDREKEDIRAFLHPSEEEGGAHRQRVRAAMLFILSCRELPLLAWPRELLDSLIELEQVFLIFRQRHARMVERVIGRRTGTGGSAGVDYLDQTALRYRIFRDLWAVRTFQIRREALPRPENEDFYGFRSSPGQGS